jgi:myo-inositol-1(or 4)-monophosphatase
METKELEGIRDFLVSVAHEAGDMILSAHPTTGSSGSKKNCEFDTST